MIILAVILFIALLADTMARAKLTVEFRENNRLLKEQNKELKEVLKEINNIP